MFCGRVLLFAAFVATEPRAEDSLSNDGFHNFSRHPSLNVVGFLHPPPTATPLIYAPLYSTVYYKSFDAVHSFMFWDNSHMMSTLEDSRGLENEVREHALPSRICTKTRRLEESIILLIHVNCPSLWQVSTYLLHCRLLVDQLVRGPVRQALWRGKQ